MTYEEFVTNPFSDNAGWLVIVAIVLVSASIVCILEGLDRRKGVRKGGTLMAVVAGIVLVGSVVGSFSLLALHSTTYDQNRTIAENNLKQKYNIASVLWGRVPY